MPIGLRMLDAQIAQALRARARQVLSLAAPVTPETISAHRILARGGGLATARDQVLACIGLGGACFLAGAALGEPVAGVLVGGLGFSISLVAAHAFAARGSLDRLDDRIAAEELDALASLVQLDATDRLYVDAVVRLAAAGRQLPDTSVREIIREMNEVVRQSRQLDTHREHLLAAMGGEAPGALEEQRAHLELRRAATADRAARDSVEQSLELLDRRLASARELQPSLERVEAQREVLRQALATVHSSAARLQAAPEPLRAPDLDQIRSCVAEVTGQTRAVEQAVQEVLALRVESGG